MDTAESLPKIVMSENLPAELAKIAQEYGSISALARRLGLGSVESPQGSFRVNGLLPLRS
jgi:hypothetical protein